jgi:hypothetical protein
VNSRRLVLRRAAAIQCRDKLFLADVRTSSRGQLGDFVPDLRGATIKTMVMNGSRTTATTRDSRLNRTHGSPAAGTCRGRRFDVEVDLRFGGPARRVAFASLARLRRLLKSAFTRTQRRRRSSGYNGRRTSDGGRQNILKILCCISRKHLVKSIFDPYYRIKLNARNPL